MPLYLRMAEGYRARVAQQEASARADFLASGPGRARRFSTQEISSALRTSATLARIVWVRSTITVIATSGGIQA